MARVRRLRFHQNRWCHARALRYHPRLVMAGPPTTAGSKRCSSSRSGGCVTFTACTDGCWISTACSRRRTRTRATRSARARSGSLGSATFEMSLTSTAAAAAAVAAPIATNAQARRRPRAPLSPTRSSLASVDLTVTRTCSKCSLRSRCSAQLTASRRASPSSSRSLPTLTRRRWRSSTRSSALCAQRCSARWPSSSQ